MSVRYLTDKNDDGTNFGQATTEKIGFYGLTTPIVQPTLTPVHANSASAPIATSPLYGFASLAQGQNIVDLVYEIRANLVALGLMG